LLLTGHGSFSENSARSLFPTYRYTHNEV
jgi:hypothetical protein